MHGSVTRSLYLRHLSVEETEGLARACEQIERSDAKVPLALWPARGLLGKSHQKQQTLQRERGGSSSDGQEAAAVETGEVPARE